jgi:UDP-GlcNAc:undecaprenyl-phosphate/decaprenyl-phosphate GlcNAc-1-phosphate transferase
LNYLSIFLLNCILLALYYRIAVRYEIIDKPNLRSSHDYITIRGAGIIFLITGLYWSLFNLDEQLYFAIGLFAIGLISFADDVFNLPSRTRFIVHASAVTLALINLDLLSSNILLLTLVMILYIGWINAFNFMDGINAITAFYSISILLPIIIALPGDLSVYTTLAIYLSISVLIFMVLNVRKRAIAFSGDVGAVVLAFTLAYLVLVLIINTGRVEIILFGSVYGVDTIFTILRRLKGGQNIFQAHRMHLYQILTNEFKWNYLSVSILYSVTQLIISFIVLFSIQKMPNVSMTISFVILSFLIVFYLFALYLVRPHNFPSEA